MTNISLGVVGESLGHSISPAIHSIIFEELGIKKAVYSIYEVDKNNSGNIVDAIKTLGVRGTNVTIPYKKTVMDQLDNISDRAMEIGAVNTISIKDGISTGDNTDYLGLEKVFDKMGLELKDKTVVVLGNGGASKAVQALLSNKKVKELTVISRSDDWFPGYDYLDIIGGKDMIINTTPVGMYPNVDDCVVSESVIKKFKYAVDIIYNPAETMFLKMARENGLVTENGLGMLVYQAIYAENIWLDTEISDETSERIYKRAKELFE